MNVYDRPVVVRFSCSSKTVPIVVHVLLDLGSVTAQIVCPCTPFSSVFAQCRHYSPPDPSTLHNMVDDSE